MIHLTQLLNRFLPKTRLSILILLCVTRKMLANTHSVLYILSSDKPWHVLYEINSYLDLLFLKKVFIEKNHSLNFKK